MEKITFHPCIVKYLKLKNGQIVSAHFYPDIHGNLYTDFDLKHNFPTYADALKKGIDWLQGEKFHVVAYSYCSSGVIYRSTVLANVSSRGKVVGTRFLFEFLPLIVTP